MQNVHVSSTLGANLQKARGYPPEAPAPTNIGNMDTDGSLPSGKGLVNFGSSDFRSSGEYIAESLEASKREGAHRYLQWFLTVCGQCNLDSN